MADFVYETGHIFFISYRNNVNYSNFYELSKRFLFLLRLEIQFLSQTQSVSSIESLYPKK